MRGMTYHSGVGEELVTAAVYYEGQRKGLGERFLDDYEHAISEIAANPMAWPPIGGDYRRRQLRHFPFGIIYRILSGRRVRVLAIMHLHKRPGYWMDRG